jgi:hypothetical protein
MSFTLALKLTWVLSLALLAGCSDESETPAERTPAPAPSPAQVIEEKSPGNANEPHEVVTPARPRYDPALATARIVVRARTDGPLPEMRRITLDAKSAAAHPEGLFEETVVEVDGRLANVVAWISSGHDRWEHESSKAPPASLHARGTRLIPHVVSLGTGTPLEITTEEGGCYSLHLRSRVNVERSLGRPFGSGLARTTEFSEPELGIRVTCDVHGWMKAWVHVFDHPFHGVTGSNGDVTLSVPPGSYEVSTWHEWKFGTLDPIAVTVAKGESREVTFVFRSK